MQGSERRLEARIEALEERERRKPSQADKAFVERATPDTFTWVTKHTRTYNEHWQKEGRPRPDEPFPPHHYLAMLFAFFEIRDVVFIEKSRDLMISWACVAYLTLQAMKMPYCGVLFQAQNDKKVIQLVDYAKCMWRNSDERIKRFPSRQGARTPGGPRAELRQWQLHPWPSRRC